MFNSIFYKFPNVFGESMLEDLMRPVMVDPFDGIDVIDDEQTVTLRLDVPGMKREDLKVELREGLLMIKGKRSDSNDGLRHRGRRSIEISKSFNLDDDLDHDRIEATCSDGVLEITLYKKPKSFKQIEIR